MNFLLSFNSVYIGLSVTLGGTESLKYRHESIENGSIEKMADRAPANSFTLDVEL